MQGLGDAATGPLRFRSARFVLHKAALDSRFDPARLRNAIDSGFEGIGAGPRIFGGTRIIPGIRNAVAEYKQGY
jgi:hypothetical protein